MPTSTALIESFREQVRWCDKLGSAFTARLLEALVQDWQDGGPMRTLLPAWTVGPPATDLVPLRLAGGLHALAVLIVFFLREELRAGRALLCGGLRRCCRAASGLLCAGRQRRDEGGRGDEGAGGDAAGKIVQHDVGSDKWSEPI